MNSLYELSILAGAVYENSPSSSGWTCSAFRPGGGRWDQLQAAAFTKGSETVVAFRGTTASADDVLADLKLGSGMNTSHFAAADEFISDYLKTDNVTVCGHSLGGAIAQIVGNRWELKFATFNAPGVAVFASRNILDANPAMLAVRAVGSVASAIWSPRQALKDIKATFNVAKGVNLCLAGDVVSKIGVHYGKVVRIPGTGWNPASQHGIATVTEVLATNPVGMLGVDSYC